MSRLSTNSSFTRVARTLTIAAAMFSLASSAQAAGLGFRGALVSLSNGARVAQVQSVARGSLGQKMGLRQGDQIVSINGFFPGNATWNQQAMRSDNGRVTVVVNRFGKRVTLNNQHCTTGANSFADRVSGSWRGMVDGHLVVVTFTKQGKLRMQEANQLTGRPIERVTVTGRWKVQGKNLLVKIAGEVHKNKIVKLNGKTMALVTEEGETQKFFKNWNS